jgi:alpha-L-fucosidase 2
MKKLIRILSLMTLGIFLTISVRADSGPMMLWYTNAAMNWTEALPVGNGKLAAMVFGGAASEHIQFNEDTIWTGQPHDYSHPGASNYLADIQRLIFAGKGVEAWKNSTKSNFMSIPVRQCGYQPAGDLFLTFPHGDVANYQRSLDLDLATAVVQYDCGGVKYRREVFASEPDKVILIRLTASRAGQLTFNCRLDSAHTNRTIVADKNNLVLHGKVTNVTPYNELSSVLEFESRVKILAKGGSVTASNEIVQVKNADAVTLLLSVASSFVNYHDVSGNPSLISSNIIQAASAKNYSTLRRAQLSDYQNLFRRVTLDLGTSWKTNLPTDVRIKLLNIEEDPQLVALYFQMGRYLMISGSRPGSQPLNLQGKWNNNLNPPWESKMTLNINEEMNYWGGEVCNLGECQLPLFDMIQDLSETGKIVARTHYNAGGWVVHHNTDLWRGAAPINGADGVWPLGGAWLCQHLWWHYEYDDDTNFLANTAYPLMKGAAQFFVDFLIPDPRPSVTNMWLVTNPSFSPEHGDDVAAPTMDNELLRDLFSHVIEASRILNVDAAFRTNLIAIRAQLPPDQIGKYGQLQEWLEDVDVPNSQHRHMSPLVGLFPGNEISPNYTPALAAAAEKLVDWRGDPVNNNGWSKAWRMCLRDCLFQGDHAYMILTNTMARDISPNMVFMRSNTQIDGTFGLMAGIAEMFLQSQSGEIFLLPALPSNLPSGSVNGLRARGGFVVDIQWREGKLSGATIHSESGNVCRLRSKWPIEVKSRTAQISAAMIAPGLYEFSTVAGGDYKIIPSAAAL